MNQTAEGNILSIDIGGSGIKGMVLSPSGEPVAQRIRIPTPRPATPEAVIDTVGTLIDQFGDYERISVGFPGVVRFGVVHTGVNFDGDWSAVPLADAIRERSGKPCRIANDADVQGFGVIEGYGVEMVLTLGTGMGAAVFSNGHLVPNLELGHHPLAEGRSYEEWIGQAARERLGDEVWKSWVSRAIDTILPIWNPQTLYVGGGNAKHIDFELPDGVVIVPNVAGILGGVRLWQDEDH